MLISQMPLPVFLPCETISLSSVCILASSDKAVKILRRLVFIFDVASNIFLGFKAAPAHRTVFWMFVGLFVFAEDCVRMSEGL